MAYERKRGSVCRPQKCNRVYAFCSSCIVICCTHMIGMQIPAGPLSFSTKPVAILTKYGWMFRGWLPHPYLNPLQISSELSQRGERWENTLDLVILLFGGERGVKLLCSLFHMMAGKHWCCHGKQTSWGWSNLPILYLWVGFGYINK